MFKRVLVNTFIVTSLSAFDIGVILVSTCLEAFFSHFYKGLEQNEFYFLIKCLIGFTFEIILALDFFVKIFIIMKLLVSQMEGYSDFLFHHVTFAKLHF